jgi:hypothetical protein
MPNLATIFCCVSAAAAAVATGEHACSQNMPIEQAHALQAHESCKSQHSQAAAPSQAMRITQPNMSQSTYREAAHLLSLILATLPILLPVVD